MREGYDLHTALMRWFYDHVRRSGRPNRPAASLPCVAADLSGLPPAVVVTAEFDLLRDEGDAYADALEAAGVPTEHIRARGHTHCSLTMVDLVISGAPIREEIAAALRAVLRASQLDPGQLEQRDGAWCWPGTRRTRARSR